MAQEPRNAANGTTEHTRRLIAPTFSAGVETGIFAAVLAISMIYIFAGGLASDISFPSAVEFAAMAIPGCVVAVLLCGRLFHRLNFVSGITLVVIAVTAVVIIAHLVQHYWLSELENPQDLLIRRLLFANFLVAFMLRQSTLQHRLRVGKAAEQTAKLQALQSRIRPHFLFNSMNVISSLIPVNPDKAEQVVEDLSELFRANLQRACTFVRISAELDLCQRYLHIESLRLGERLRVEWQVETAPAEAKMPLLILQPLLENAIYHGIQPLPKGGTIRVEVQFTADEMIARITNPLMQQTPAKLVTGSRIAIDNIQQRLDVVYGKSAKLVTKQDSNHFQAELRCPTVPKII